MKLIFLCIINILGKYKLCLKRRNSVRHFHESHYSVRQSILVAEWLKIYHLSLTRVDVEVSNLPNLCLSKDFHCVICPL